jgi:protein-tyrosine phosphatase
MILGMSVWFRTYGFAEILENLLIGAYPLDAEDVSMLDWMGVQRVLNLVEDEEYRPGDREAVLAALAETGIIEQRLHFTDFGRLPAAELEAAVTEVSQWLDEGLRTYLHCRAGQQRSAAVGAGVVALRQGVGIDEALAHVQQRKPSADPLPHQREDLAQWWDTRGSAPADPGEAGNPPGQADGLPGDAGDLLRGP